MTQSLQQQRTVIDELDLELLRLINRRAQAVAEIARLKLEHSLPVSDEAREAAILNAACRAQLRAAQRRQPPPNLRLHPRRKPPSPVPSGSGVLMHKIASTHASPFRESPEPSARSPPASCSATRSRPSPVPPSSRSSAPSREGRADLILAPLENTLAGPVLRCYDLLYQGSLRHDWRSRPAHQPLRHRLSRRVARRRSAASSRIPLL